jgi:hypothetical protein
MQTPGEHDRTDSWQIVGDSLRCIYRNGHAGGMVTSAISSRTGSAGRTRTLIETTMNPEHEHMTWFGPENALIVLSLQGRYRRARRILKSLLLSYPPRPARSKI